MSSELLIFIGYSQDAKEEARAIGELKPELQDRLKHFNQVASSRSIYSTLDIFDCEASADAVVGGQSAAITPHLECAAVAVFIFKERVGKVTWEELNNCRNRPIEKRIPTLAFFSSMPPTAERLIDREVARSWADLLDRKSELIEDWTHEHSRSVTPLESYRDINHLRDIFMKRINALLPSLIVGNDVTSLIQGNTAQVRIISDAIPSNYLDSITDLAQFDTKAVQQYRSLMRSDARLALPSDIPDDEFLRRTGYLRGGRLTIVGALLFTSSPSKVIPSALIRCSKYDGEDKATSRNWHNCDGPLLTQILGARDFIANNIGHREEPVNDSMQSSTTYEYPMVCIREILANAVCHRNYEDQARLIYVTIYNNRIEIKSPGNWCSTSLPEGKAVALSHLISESIQRNMRLAHAISSVGMMEVEGSGIPTAVDDCINCSAPKPSVVERNGYVIVAIYPSEFWDTDNEGSITAQRDVFQEPLVAVKLDNQLQTRNKEAEAALQRALEEVNRLKNQLQQENIYRQEERKLEYNFSEVVGSSDAVKMADTAPVMIWMASTDKLRTYFNKQWLDFTGRSLEEESGNGWVDGVHPDDYARCIETYAVGFDRRESFKMEYRLRRADGAYRWVLDTGTPRLSSEGEFLGYIGSCVDIHDRKESEDALRSVMDEVNRLNNQLREENTYLQEEIRGAGNFDEIIGRSEALRRVLSQAEKVAPADATVLLLGETGTGKELFAHAIHNLSPRNRHPLVKVNCAALPAPLIESELFGHEKGAFTGASARRRGRFELADGGTIFLDEVGELPSDLQSKLLRVLEEGEFERVGGSRTLKVNVRVIAATNRRLEEAVRNGTFRSDLYYRFSVYPITLPPLRERPEDIPALVTHFVKQLGTKMGKEIETVPQGVMAALQNYYWPGNVRELRNVIERAVINSGPVLHITNFAGTLRTETLSVPNKTLEEMEREYIITVLDSTGWRIEGRHGAAMILGLPPSTLRNRMAKLDITRMAKLDITKKDVEQQS